MPKISSRPVVSKTMTPKRETVPCPVSAYNVDRNLLLNLQTCSCGHDRLCHGNYIGKGEDRRLIIDLPNAGPCGVKGCKCGGFILDPDKTSSDGIKRYAKERSDYPKTPVPTTKKVK